ncbi:MAG: alkaline phosphatase family protein [bacterium]|nr:alkaline phosphatase family protein [bacterium]
MFKKLFKPILFGTAVFLLTSIYPVLSSAQEEQPAPEQRQRMSPAERFKQMDKDGDGKLTESEFPRPEFFKQLDKNGDGYVTETEFTEAMAQFRDRRAAERQAQDTTASLSTTQSPIVPIVREPRIFPKNVILISWDGLDRSVVKELLAQNQLLNLARLIREGSMQDIEVTGHVTVTKPGHAEMLTGLSADQTGVYSNMKFQPIPEGYTVFERLQKQLGGKAQIRTIMVTGKLAHVGNRGPEEAQKSLLQKKKKLQKKAGEQTPPGADDTIKSVKGEPFYLTKTHLDVCDVAQRSAAEVGQLSLKYLAEHKDSRFFAFLHFSDPDHAGHQHGIDSKEYREAAIACDDQLGKIMTWLKEGRLYTQTLIYVMTDHGFDEHGKSHSFAPHSWLVTNDKKVTRSGIIADVPATIMVRFGIDISKLDPKLLGYELTGPAREIKPSDYVQPEKKQKQAKQPQQKKMTVEERFNKFDTNTDGILTADEFPRPNVFEKMDTNSDNKVTLEEAKSFYKNRQTVNSTQSYSTITAVP